MKCRVYFRIFRVTRLIRLVLPSSPSHQKQAHRWLLTFTLPWQLPTEIQVIDAGGGEGGKKRRNLFTYLNKRGSLNGCRWFRFRVLDSRTWTLQQGHSVHPGGPRPSPSRPVHRWAERGAGECQKWGEMAAALTCRSRAICLPGPLHSRPWCCPLGDPTTDGQPSERCQSCLG